MNTQPKQLLIAGMGFLGRDIAKLAMNRGWQVIGLSKSGGKDGECNVLACDLGDEMAVAEVAKNIGNVSAVIHCASSGGGGAEAYRSVFCDGTKALQKTFPAARLVLISSTSVYHQTNGETVTERSETLPNRETSQVLLEAEQLVIQPQSLANISGTVLRLGGLYGPGRSYLLTRFLKKETQIEGDGSRIVNQIHVQDAAAAVLHVLSMPRSDVEGDIFNVADGTPMTQLQLYTELSELFGLPLPPMGPKKTQGKRAWTSKKVSIEKIRATGWTPQHTPFPSVARDIAKSLGFSTP